MIHCGLALFLLLAAAGAVGAADAPRYTVRTFAPPFEPARVNNRGVVLANSRDRAGGRRAALVDGDKVTVLPTLGGAHAVATGFNDRNEVVGHSQLAGPDHVWHAFLYRDGVMTDLGRSDSIESEAVAINSAGQIIGNIHRPDGTSRCFLHWPGTGRIDIGTLGGPNCDAYLLGESGDVIGNAQMAGGDMAYFVYREGVMREFRPGLDALEGFAPNGLALPLNMNVVLKVSGRYAVGRDAATMVPVLLIDGAEMYALDDLAGDDWRAVEGISVNQSGQIVARACKAASGHCEAVLLTPVVR